jgi:hypothetical protein
VGLSVGRQSMHKTFKSPLACRHRSIPIELAASQSTTTDPSIIPLRPNATPIANDAAPSLCSDKWPTPGYFPGPSSMMRCSSTDCPR